MKYSLSYSNIEFLISISSPWVYDQRLTSSVILKILYLKNDFIIFNKLGAAHGISAILFTLMCCDNFLASDANTEREVKLSVDYILSLQTQNGNFPCATDEIGYQMRSDQDYELVHWCHGAPGTFPLHKHIFF